MCCALTVNRFNGPLRGRAPITAVSAARFAPSLEERATVDCNATITPACLQTLYGIPTQMVSSSTKSKIGVAGYTPQNADSVRGNYGSNFVVFDRMLIHNLQEDLSTFLKEFRPDLPSTLNFITELYDGATNVQDGTQAGLEAVRISALYDVFPLLSTL